MIRTLFLSIILVLLTNSTSAQDHVRGYSSPGRLRKSPSNMDTCPPTITIIEPAGMTMRGNDTRGVRVEPKVAGEIIIRGIVADDEAVATLAINGQNIRLRGTATQKKFGIKLASLEPGSARKLVFVAVDGNGNTTEKNCEIRGGIDVNSAITMIFTPGREMSDTGKLTKAGQYGDHEVLPSFGRYWALVIGVSEYTDPGVKDLENAVLDAQDIATTLTEYYTFDPGLVEILINPTRAQLIKTLSDYAPTGSTPLGDDDNLLVYYAGHGYWDEDYREGYWLLSDAEQYNRANWVSNSDVQRAFRGIKARHILLLSDACFSGSLFATRQPFSKAVEEAYKEPSRKAITAGNLTEVPDRSVFKEYLVKRLVENENICLDAGSLYNSIKEPVTNNSPISQRPIYGVIQQTGDEGGEFIFVKRR